MAVGRMFAADTGDRPHLDHVPDPGYEALTCPIRGRLTTAIFAKDGLTYTEEYRRIDFIKYLLKRGYPKEAIQAEVVLIKRLGESGRNTLRADVVVYDHDVSHIPPGLGERLKHILVVAEIKRDSTHRDSGIENQLTTALRQLPLELAVGVYWDDQLQQLYAKQRTTTEAGDRIDIVADSLANLPDYGTRYRSTPITVSKLVRPHNLVGTLQGIADTMRSHSINDEGTRYRETVKLLLARYVDEEKAIATESGVLTLQDRCEPDKVFRRKIDGLYEAAAHRYYRAKQVFTPAMSTLSDAALRACVKKIEGLNLSAAPGGILQQVFMTFVPAVLDKKSLDQYFTPLTLIDAMVRMAEIGPTDIVADPAMGTGDFLTSAMSYRTQHGDTSVASRVRGIDKDPRAYELAVINMILNHDGQGGLECLDSLEKHDLWYEQVDVALCNPPFGSRTIETRASVLTHYDLGHCWEPVDAQSWTKTSTVGKSQQLGILFIERCWKMLTPGGRIAIILPEGYLSTPKYGYVRQWILEHFEVRALIELPRRIFVKADADLRANILIGKKRNRVVPLEEVRNHDTPVFADMVRKVGYKLGKGYSALPKRDPKTGDILLTQNNEQIVDTDFTRVVQRYHSVAAATSGFRFFPTNTVLGSTLDIAQHRSLDLKPRRLTPSALSNMQAITKATFVRLSEIASLAQPGSLPTDEWWSLVTGADIRAVEGTVIPQDPIRQWRVKDSKPGDLITLHDTDIVVGLVRPERRNIGYLITEMSNIVAPTDGVAALRSRNNDDYPQGWLFSCLRSEAVRLQFWTESGGTSYGKLTPSIIESILIPLPTVDERHAINETVEAWASSLRSAHHQWMKIGTQADRVAIINSPLTGLVNDDNSQDGDG